MTFGVNTKHECMNFGNYLAGLHKNVARALACDLTFACFKIPSSKSAN